MRPRLLVLSAVAAATLAVPGSAPAASLERIGIFNQPVYVTSLPDPNRLLVVEQGGTIQLWQGGAASTFLDIRDRVLAGGERGLLSVAVAPNYPDTRHIYVFYTRLPDGALQLDEFTVSHGTVPLDTRRPVLTIPHPTFGNHNGGQLQFGPDGYLYASTGDGGGAGDPFGNAQNPASLLGKILRIDPRPRGSAPYTVPARNPFGTPVWALGLRNPWRFSFDAATGDLLIGDVGQGTREEVDLALSSSGAGRGLNFGWNCREGSISYPSAPTGCASAGPFTSPVFDYPTHVGGTCAITGGYVVRDQSVPDLYGRYLYSDACAGQLRSLVPAFPTASGDRAEALRVDDPSSFGQDTCRRIYVTSLSGPVARLVGSAPPDCSAVLPPGTNRRCGGLAATRIPAANGSVVGTADRDVIVGNGRRNRIRARGGNDLICAGGGADRVKAGPGRDSIRAGAGRDRCAGGPGEDELRSC
jgi:glucose/arabinose dehydrogenase